MGDRNEIVTEQQLQNLLQFVEHHIERGRGRERSSELVASSDLRGAALRYKSLFMHIEGMRIYMCGEGADWE